jgi:hypothetical protein
MNEIRVQPDTSPLADKEQQRVCQHRDEMFPESEDAATRGIRSRVGTDLYKLHVEVAELAVR